MKLPPSVVSALWLTRLLLDPRDVDRIVLPALRDALEVRAGWVASHVLWVAVHCLTARIADAARATRWAFPAMASLASALGWLGLQGAPGGAPLAARHALFAVLGAALAAWITTCPRRWLAPFGSLSAIVAAAALVAVAWSGAESAGVRRWLRFGAWSVQISTLALPVFVAVVARAANRWAPAVAASVGLGALGLVALQRDPTAVVLYGVVAVATDPRRSVRGAVLGIGSAILVWTFWCRRIPSPALHVEGALDLLAAQGTAWLFAGVAAVGAVASKALHTWWRSRRLEGASMLRGAAVGLVAILILPRAFGDGGIPWLSFGGSAVVAAHVLLGLLVRAERESAAVPRAVR
jgi:hypothetical protein